MNWGRLFFGMVIITAGTLLLLGNADVIDSDAIFATWWPLVIILAGVISMVANSTHWPIGLVIVAIGTAFLLSTLDLMDLTNILWPSVLIIVGLVVIFGRGRRTQSDSGDTLNSFHMFSGSEVVSRSSQFRGGSVSAIFGGAEIDLRQAQLAPDATLDVFLAFGGLEIKVPEGWHVVVKGFPVFGGFDNKTAKDRLPDNAPVFLINATAFFGGVEIKH